MFGYPQPLCPFKPFRDGTLRNSYAPDVSSFRGELTISHGLGSPTECQPSTQLALISTNRAAETAGKAGPERSSHEHLAALRRVSTKRSDQHWGSNVPAVQHLRPWGTGKPALVRGALLRVTPTHHISGENVLGLRSLQSVSLPDSRTTLITPLLSSVPLLSRRGWLAPCQTRTATTRI